MVDGNCLDVDCEISHKRSINQLENHGYVVLESWLSDAELLQQYHDWHDPLVTQPDLDRWEAAVQGATE